ncbi:MAG: EFR1 family ferrodoxin [Candidatus Cloacimonetes bacterium]|nr:EFR1 family ferrodoxin [Candidatus Cloacimonadota bacterium]
MKGIICYYSGSGNTKLAMEYLNKKVSTTDFNLYNVVKSELPDLSKYDVVGFATFTDFGDIPQYYVSFLDKIEEQPDKPAFIINTFGAISGKTLKLFADRVETKHFTIISAYSLHTPENYPPMRKRNIMFDKAPKPRELKKFDTFISRLDEILKLINNGQSPEKKQVKVGFLWNMLPNAPRTQAKKDFGIQQVDENLCKECGLCAEVCPYEAITLSPKPVFNHEKCYGCWACYNHCPEQAIYTRKFRGTHQYPKPNAEMVKKFG